MQSSAGQSSSCLLIYSRAATLQHSAFKLNMTLNISGNFAFALLLIVGIWTLEATSRSLPEPSMAERHEQWMALHGRVYKDATEKEMRFEIFKANVENIEAFNSVGDKSYKRGMNAFTDLTNEEFRASRNGFKVQSDFRTTVFKYENLTAVPSTMDWRKKGAVTPVKDQGQCGKHGITDVAGLFQQ
ncbi:hypothetical protein L6452_19926 [Arctium lappa]|uniref:Uncharacterized protein n=1 Tax=Arctium lappa TaxID=4217 RepID=A0ACB9BAH0_ARCLA|nr:hypothetical protein L6452_19926 [Arctium lappa]